MRFLLLLSSFLLICGCGSDKAGCGGVINTGSITGPINSNCAGGGTGPGDNGGKAGTSKITPAPVVITPIVTAEGENH